MLLLVLKALGMWHIADLKHYPSLSVVAFRVTQLLLFRKFFRWWQKLPSGEQEEQLLVSSVSLSVLVWESCCFSPKGSERDFCLPGEVRGFLTVTPPGWHRRHARQRIGEVLFLVEH